MRTILTTILLLLLQNAYSQSKSLINMANGDINISDNCCITHYGTFSSFGDIAYGNNKIYGINDSLHIIDFETKQIVNSFSLNDSIGNPIGGNGLEIIHDSLLFFESYHKLYCFNLNNYNIEFKGDIGYSSSGDLLFVNNKLYMTTTSGELIAINLNTSFAVNNISIINSDSISINSGFGISRSMNPNEILIYSGYNLYGFDTVLKEYHKICDLEDVVDGATFYEESITENNLPNIITPNNDNVNEFIDLSEFSRYSIFNRWGEEIFNDPTIKIWKGENKNGNPLSEGIYFIVIHSEECGQEKIFSKPITIVR